MKVVVTKFLRKRNPNVSLDINKNFARIQVSGNAQTFVFKKTDIPISARLLTQADDFLNTESSERINIG